jgi:uncharacterized protein YejL (UPF0352 family)
VQKGLLMPPSERDLATADRDALAEKFSASVRSMLETGQSRQA